MVAIATPRYQSRLVPPKQSDRRSAGVSFPFGVILIGVILSYVFEAPIRYALSLVKAEFAIYLRDVVAIVLLFVEVGFWVLARRSHSWAAVILALFGFHFAVGVLNLQSLIQPIIGLKVFLAFVFGVCIADRLRYSYSIIWKWSAVLFLAASAGVVMNYFISYPWEGMIIGSAIGERVLTRDWTAGGVKRLAGFSRASFDAASIILVLAVPLIVRFRRNAFVVVLVLVVGGGSIALTTSKGALLALAVLFIWLVVRYWLGWSRVAGSIAWLLLILCVAFPLFSAITGLHVRLNSSGSVAWWFSSFLARMQQMWPDAFTNISNDGAIIFGRGLGGIGFPQLFGEAARYNSADNVAVYFYSVFGLLAIPYLYYITASGAPTKAVPANSIASIAEGWVVAWLCYGFTTNMVEQSFFSIASGVCVGLMLTANECDSGEVRQGASVAART